MVVSAGGRTTRSYTLSRRRIRFLKVGAVLSVIAVLVLSSSWIFLFKAWGDNRALTVRVLELEGENRRVAVLADQLRDLEERYRRLVQYLEAGDQTSASQLWLPPPGGRPAPQAASSAGSDTPVSWPLADEGFVTQPRVERQGEDHAGVDIAVPTGTYVRAAGGGVVAEAGEDDVYGNFVRLEHGDGYSTLYAHASVVFVTVGARVRQNEVIALSGSTGQSSAPHLHFEVRLNGETLDPLTLVSPPS
jgi:murein DD-endopeptidase MepM/ murein hydrolase activator NlpD